MMRVVVSVSSAFAVKLGIVTFVSEAFRCFKFSMERTFDVELVFVPLLLLLLLLLLLFVTVVVPGGTIATDADCGGRIPKFRILSTRASTTDTCTTTSGLALS